MNYTARRPILLGCVCLLALLLLRHEALAGEVPVSYADKYAWAENAGWLRFKSTHATATLHADGANSFITGYAWAENIGWVKLAYDDNGPFANTGTTDWGVNMNAAGECSGYAWSETVGWINFNPSDGQVTYDATTGTMDGYAWAENVGWIHFQNAAPAYNVAFKFAVPSVTTTAVSAITKTTASSGGNVVDDGGDSVSARGACWNTTGTPTTSNSKTSNGTGTGAYTSSLTSLTADTTYYVRAYATNGKGTGYGSQVSFKTSSDSSGGNNGGNNGGTGGVPGVPALGLGWLLCMAVGLVLIGGYALRARGRDPRQ